MIVLGGRRQTRRLEFKNAMDAKPIKPAFLLAVLSFALFCVAAARLSAQQTDPVDPQLRDAYRRVRFERQFPPEAVAYIQAQLQNEERASKKLAELATDQRPEIRSLVALLLGELGQPEGAATLWKLIRDDVELVRITAAGAFVRLRSLTSFPVSTDGLRDERNTVRRLVAAALCQLADKAAEGALIDALRDDDERVRMEIVQALGPMSCGTAAAMPSMVEMLHDPSVPVRDRTARVLGQFSDPVVVTHLIQALKDPDWHVRAAAADSLGGWVRKEPSAIAPLIAVLQGDEYALVRDRAADSLALPEDEKSINALVEAILSDNRDARYHAAKAIVKSRATSALPKLVDRRNHADPEVRLKIYEVVGGIGGTDQVTVLLEATSDADANVRIAAIDALRRLRERGAVKVLIERLNDPSPHVRAHSARVLGELGDRESVKAVVSLLRDSNGFVRGAAAEALGKLGDATAVPSLVQVLTGERGADDRENVDEQGLVIGTGARELPDVLRQKRVEEKVKAVQALGEIADPSAADPIINNGLRAQDATLRAESAIALGKMKVERAVEPLKETVAPYYQDIPMDTENIIASETSVPDSVRLAREKDARVRASVAWALGQIGNPGAVQTLNRALNDPNSLVRDAAIEALQKITERQEEQADKERPRASR